MDHHLGVSPEEPIYEGRVEGVSEINGYIKPISTLPPPFHLNPTVIFPLDLASVAPGRKVEFKLDTSRKSFGSSVAKAVWLCEEGNLEPEDCSGGEQKQGYDSEERINGIVVEREEEYGYITPGHQLPTGFHQINVRFPTWLIDVDVGDKVQFTLKKGSKRNPVVETMRLQEDIESLEDQDRKTQNISMDKAELIENEFGTNGNTDGKGGSIDNADSSGSSVLEQKYDMTQGAAKLQLPVSAGPSKLGKKQKKKQKAMEKKDQSTGADKTGLTHETTVKKIPTLEGQRLRGKINKVIDTIGFIEYQCKEGTTNPFSGPIFFHKGALRSGGLPVVSGDIVDFTVGLSKKYTDEKKKWVAYNVKVIQFRTRGNLTLGNILEDMKQKVISKDENSDTLLEMINVEAVWELFAELQDIQKENMIKLINLILFLQKKTNAAEQNFKNVLDIITRGKLCNTKTGPLKRLIDLHWSNGSSEFDETIKDFFSLVIENLPHRARMITLLSKGMLPPGNIPMVEFLYEMLKKVTLSTTSEIIDLEWNELPLVPSDQELVYSPMAGRSHLQPVMRKGAYQSPHEYMDIYFRLLREDCFSAIRSGINDYLENKLDPRDMKVYNQVRLMGLNISEFGGGISLAMKVTPQNKVNNWETCSNLMFGNLLCFSPSGKFTDPIWATVKQRDIKLLKKHQIIWVELCSESNSRDDISCVACLHEASGRTVLAESPTYYVAYQSVLRALQKSDPEELSFQEELVHVKKPLPSACFKDFQNKPPPTSMDDSQKEAFSQALKQRISIIQGPPGTGKTYIGIEIVRRILAHVDKEELPILVLTYKNHALDEFLTAILQFIPGKVARVGGRSKESAIENININVLKRELKRSALMYSQKNELKLDIAMKKRQLEYALRDLEESKIFSWNTLIHTFSGPQFESLLLGSVPLCTLPDQNEASIDLVALWKSKEEIIYNEELTPDEKITGLGRDFIRWIQCAIPLWLPDKSLNQNIMTNEERLSSFLATQSKICKKNPEKDIDNEGTKDETDVEDEEIERLAAISPSEKTLEMTVDFTHSRLSHTNLPEMHPCAERLAQEISSQSIKGITNIWQLEPYDRAVVIQVLIWQHRCTIEEKIKTLFSSYKGLQNSYKELENTHAVAALKSTKVVGMTITGASIHQRLLQVLQPAIIIVEEAAEVLEPQLIAVLGNWAKQLILIGDHKQLRPSVETYDLVKNYNFDLSMMERLIENDFPYRTLQTQNRMRPEMAKLLLDIYPGLKSNIDRVNLNEVPDFIPSSIYFWSHEDREGVGGEQKANKALQEATQLVMHGRSMINVPEAEKAINLALLFIQQGYEPKDITILAAYQGQVKLLRALYRKAETTHQELLGQYNFSDATMEQKPTGRNQVRSHTIDMYQGDENKIVIISLVRSNEYGNIGFLKSLNRRCVAQSRAKCGMYFIGNFNTLKLSRQSPWGRLIDSLAESALVGSQMTFFCKVHPQNQTLATTAADIPIDGLCKKECGKRMDCLEHICEKTCQPFHSHDLSMCTVQIIFKHEPCGHEGRRKCSISQTKVRCKMPCPKLMECNIHPCSRTCQPPHKHDTFLCNIEVSFIFSACGHEGKKKCGENESNVICNARVSFKKESCAHTVTRKCFQKEEDISCNELCPRLLKCGHPCDRLCGEICDSSQCEFCKKIQVAELAKIRKLERESKERAVKEAKKELARLKQEGKEMYSLDLSTEGDTASEYLDIEDRVKKYIVPIHKWFPNVTKIEKIFSPKLEMKWHAAKTKLADPTRSELKFHGTAEENILKIITEGFKLSSPENNMFGGGVYFATDSSKSAQEQYTKGSNQLLLCDVLIGKSLTVDTARKMTGEELKSKGYDSLFAKRGTKVTHGVLNDEYVIYNPDQALPKYIIHFSQCKYEDFPALTPKMATGNTFEMHTLVPQRGFDTTNPLDIHFRIAESQFLRLTKHLNSHQSVKSVDYYVNTPLAEAFTRKQKEFEAKYPGEVKESKVVLAFHGTPKTENIDSIMKNNFDTKKCRREAYGKGIYFSEFPDISKGYAGKVNKLILCRILPGRSCNSSGGAQPLPSGYDSFIVRADQEGRGEMVVIDDPNQILPLYVITYA